MDLSTILATIGKLADVVTTPAVQQITSDAASLLERHAAANDISIDQLTRNSVEIPDPPDPDAPKEPV